MSNGKPGVLQRLTQRLTRTDDEVDSAVLRSHTREQGSVPIRDLTPRSRATIAGEVRSVTLRPRDDTPALEVEVWDGTGSLHLVWLGRRRIPGITPGIRIRATGRVTTQRRVTTIFNPAYEILGRVGQPVVPPGYDS